MNNFPTELKQRENESAKDYIMRVCASKDDYGFTWDKIAMICNDSLGTDFGESYFRKSNVKWLKEKYETAELANKIADARVCYADEENISPEASAGRRDTPRTVNTNTEVDANPGFGLTQQVDLDYKFDDIYEENPALAYQMYADKVLEVQKNKIRIADERNYNNLVLRRLAREDSIKDIALMTAKEMSSKKILEIPKSPMRVSDTKSGILCISDWHFGIAIDNIWNKYDPEIAKKRIAQLCVKTKDLCIEEGVTDLYVVNLADLIAGRIHAQIRIQSRYDVISQEMMITEILAEFLSELSNLPCINSINYYDCLDNHSRIEPNKKESMNLESLARFTPWYLKERLKENNKITIHNDNDFGQDIIAFKIGKFVIGGVHGDKDKPNKVVDNLTLYTKERFDLILTAHLHHFSCDEKNGTIVIANGSLMGTDDYAESLRLNSSPSQNFIVVGENNVAEEIHRIVLD